MNLRDLGELQLRILDMLWESGPASAGELCEAWPARPQPAYTTVLSVLQKLHRRKLVSRRRRGKAHVYAPRVEREDFKIRYVSGVKERVFGGSSAGLVAALLGDESVSERELEEIERLLATRISIPVFGILAVYVALEAQVVYELIMDANSVKLVCVAVPFIAGVWWKRPSSCSRRAVTWYALPSGPPSVGTK